MHEVTIRSKIKFSVLPMMRLKSVQLNADFYCRNDVVLIAKELLGKVIYSADDDKISSGIIIETEAYAGVTDKASHAYNNRRTSRTEVMYREGGCAYIYLCYGIHSLFNVVTSVKDVPHAVLIRGILPLSGLDLMKERTGYDFILPKYGIGPGKVTKLLGLNLAQNGFSLCHTEPEQRNIWIADEGRIVPVEEIIAGKRVGVEYAAEDANLLYRFQWVQKK